MLKDLNKKCDYSISNISIIITLVLSNLIFIYENVISAILSLLTVFIVIKIPYIRRYKSIEYIFNIIKFIFVCFEGICVLYYLYNLFGSSLLEIICFFIIIIKLLSINEIELRNLNQLFIYFILVFILLLIFSIFNIWDNIHLSSFNLSNTYAIYPISILISNKIAIDTYNISNKEINIGYFVGSILLIIIVILENIAFGNMYLLSKNPLISLADLVPFSIVPLSEWFVMYMFCFRETINVKYAYNYVKTLRRKVK